jgi:hypothetical protein
MKLQKSILRNLNISFLGIDLKMKILDADTSTMTGKVALFKKIFLIVETNIFSNISYSRKFLQFFDLLLMAKMRF